MLLNLWGDVAILTFPLSGQSVVYTTRSNKY